MPGQLKLMLCDYWKLAPRTQAHNRMPAHHSQGVEPRSQGVEPPTAVAEKSPPPQLERRAPPTAGEEPPPPQLGSRAPTTGHREATKSPFVLQQRPREAKSK